jgi:hypothetical protein
MPHCPSCGQEVEPTDDSCTDCGESVGEERSDGAEPAEADEPAATTRRGWLTNAGIVGAVLAAVCVGALIRVNGNLGVSTHRNIGENAWSDTEGAAGAADERRRGTVTLRPDEFTADPWNVTSDAGITITVGAVESGQIDVWTVADADFEGYRNGDDIPFVTGLSESGVTEPTELTAPTPPGTYWVIVDNSAVYGAEPDGEAVADVGIVVE